MESTFTVEEHIAFARHEACRKATSVLVEQIYPGQHRVRAYNIVADSIEKQALMAGIPGVQIVGYGGAR